MSAGVGAMGWASICAGRTLPLFALPFSVPVLPSVRLSVCHWGGVGRGGVGRHADQ